MTITNDYPKFSELSNHIVSLDQYGLIPTFSSAVVGFFGVNAVKAALKQDSASACKNAALVLSGSVAAYALRAESQSNLILTIALVAGAALSVAPKTKEALNEAKDAVLNQWEKLDIKSKFA